MSEIGEARAAAVAEAMDDIRAIEADLGVTREGVEAIRDRLIALAVAAGPVPPRGLPRPRATDDDARSWLYRLAQDDDDRFALYAQRSSGHGQDPGPQPHHLGGGRRVRRPGAQPLLPPHRRRRGGRDPSAHGRGRHRGGHAARRPPLDPHRRRRPSTSTATGWPWSASTSGSTTTRSATSGRCSPTSAAYKEARHGLQYC